MTSRALTLVSVISLASLGCDRLPFLGGGDSAAADSAAADSAAAAAQDSVAAAAAAAQAAAPVQQGAAPTTPPPPPPQTPQQQATVLSPPLVDEPFTPEFTGSVSPGMSRDDVIGVWGPPVAERNAGTWTYLYFRNGCERSCGTFDVVFLDAGLVVDAIVRHPGHTYTGVSSSPAGREAVNTPPRGTSGAMD